MAIEKAKAARGPQAKKGLYAGVALLLSTACAEILAYPCGYCAGQACFGFGVLSTSSFVSTAELRRHHALSCIALVVKIL
jgi:hypothetical protein